MSKKEALSMRHNSFFLTLYVALAIVLFSLSFSEVDVLFSKMLWMASIFSTLASIYTGLVRFLRRHTSAYANEIIVKPITQTIGAGFDEITKTIVTTTKLGFDKMNNALFTASMMASGREITEENVDRFLEETLRMEEV